MPRNHIAGGRFARLLAAAGLTVTVAGFVPGGIAAAAGRPAPAGAARVLPLIVRTSDGLIKGLRTGVAREFLGVPYAAPPTGALRWRPPRPGRPWRGVRAATKPGSNCAQTGSIATGVPATSTAENCLYLNVYTPLTAAHRRLPVMVWIHGGGFTGGAGSIYDGAVLAARGHAIVVTINYRLGAFGFLALRALDKMGPSGDYGLLDQQAALRWVRRNARAFGGDARDVTIFGESAGAASVCANMASPAAAGLFQRAIAESGCLLPAQTRAAAEKQGGTLAAGLGCANPATAAACMRAKPVTAILRAAGNLSWGPVLAAGILPRQPAAAFAEGRYNRVPLLQGTNHDEGRFFVGLEFDALGHPITAAQYPALIRAQFGAAAPAVLAHYPLRAYRSPDLAYSAVFTDSVFSCPALTADELAARSGVYAYEFSDPNPPNDFGITFTFPLGAAHSTELQYVFQKIPFLDVTPPFKPAQLALSDQMIGYWTRFAATGDPNGGRAREAPYWPRFGHRGQRIQELLPRATAPEPA
ncbi:MAG: carboxylesterase family protein, partial [Streptosporangiaceae bacterium]|nr:carboxylesterase family protein [Streptosporangiaceae bacterium]